jgi:hypothetical protein
LPRSTDESNPSTLPDPETNPLLNPLLAANMGRWAEVYFTSPPEKRGEAIAELLRELETDSPSQPATPPVLEAAETEMKAAPTEAPDPDVTSATLGLTCPACAHSNPPGQRFCGMCGAPMPPGVEPDEPQIARAAPSAGATWIEPGPFLRENSLEYARESDVSASANRGHDDALAPNWPMPERDIPSFALAPESVPDRYRIYVGVVLVILVAALIFMAWRGTKALSRTGSLEPAPSRTIPAARPAQASPVPQTDSAPAAAQESTAPVPPAPKRAQTEDHDEASSRNDQSAAQRPVPQIVPVAASSARAVEQNGAEEFAMAEKYLNGTSGAPRDSREAAQWLWKAVRKQNLAATMALSDLYLRGDGVTKNCDQARLLLDAAARKGGAGAGERLRNLQAFGCQ